MVVAHMWVVCSIFSGVWHALNFGYLSPSSEEKKRVQVFKSHIGRQLLGTPEVSPQWPARYYGSQQEKKKKSKREKFQCSGELGDQLVTGSKKP